ncbi:hypothetical protein niasHT_027765 [Heterodera trifolii]|uniref:BTB domain-containing protein n=1 Tax=Heterodera trifolii TaxID=157864 RepID=A0ABD2KIC4_9BILA
MSKPDTLSERIKLLLSTGHCSDVHFLVGEGDEKEHFAAHKLILIAASDVFESMFRFEAQNTKKGNDESNPIVVSDIASDVFKAVLSFIYTDDLSALNGKNTTEMLYAAKKYNVTGLVKAISYSNMATLRNIFHAFAMARLVEEELFAYRCLYYIDQNADTLFKSADDFLQIDQKILCEILERDQLAIDGELSIWNAALRWADAQCLQKGKECSGENRRAVLGPALFKIRLTHINREDFYKYIVPTGVLTVCEMVALLYHFHPDQQMPRMLYDSLQFPTHRRATYDDPNKPQGTLIMEIKKFSEFLKENDNITRISDAVVYITALPWRLIVYKSKHSLMFEAKYDMEQMTLNYKCPYSTTFRIASQKEGKADFVKKKMGKIGSDTFNRCIVGYISLSKLMCPDKGWYNKEEDTVKVTVEVTTGEIWGEEKATK